MSMKESTVRDYMNLLKSDETIDIKATNKFSVVTIVNWDFYQDKEEKTDSKDDSKRTAEGQQKDTNNNGNNADNGNKDNTLRSKLKFETHHLQLAKLLFKKIQENNPNAKEPNINSWANTFRLMMDRDERKGKEIQDVILWSQEHHFWYKNILSADKLRKQYDRLLLGMNDDRKPNSKKGKDKLIATEKPKHVEDPVFTEDKQKELDKMLSELYEEG
ncbi:hypothetical protein [Virgibacillus kimchii]